jgi:hypothetical protein
MTKQIIKKSIIKSIGFIVLCLVQIIIHLSLLLPELHLDVYVAIQAITWLAVLVTFIPSMLIREKKGSFDTQEITEIKELLAELKTILKNK